MSFGFGGSDGYLSREQSDILYDWVCQTLPRSIREVGSFIAREFGIDYKSRLGLINIPQWDYNVLMRIVSVSTLRKFWEKHPDAEQPLKTWVNDMRKADWQQPADIKAMHRSASILKNRRVVFNVKGNTYRLIVSIAFNTGNVFIKSIGTHAEYDKINAETVELE